MPTPKNRLYFGLFTTCSAINKIRCYLTSPLLSAITFNLVPTSNFNATSPIRIKNNLVNKQAGFSMIELLVAMLIFSLGLLGMASLQVTGLRMTRDAELMGRASLYANSMADHIRANPLSAVNTVTWNEVISTTLPNGVGQVSSMDQSHTISVSWLESEDSALTDSARTYELVIQL